MRLKSLTEIELHTQTDQISISVRKAVDSQIFSRQDRLLFTSLSPMSEVFKGETRNVFRYCSVREKEVVYLLFRSSL